MLLNGNVCMPSPRDTQEKENVLDIKSILEEQNRRLNKLGINVDNIQSNRNSIRQLNNEDLSSALAHKLFLLVYNEEMSDSAQCRGILEDFIKLGIDMYYYDKERKLSLMELFSRRTYSKYIKLFLNYGYDIKFTEERELETFFNFISLYDEELLEIYLILGFDINLCDSIGNTALHYAAFYNNNIATELLLNFGALEKPNSAGQLPSDIAKSKSPDIYELLQKYAQRSENDNTSSVLDDKMTLDLLLK